MTSIALNERDFAPMATDGGDSGSWVAIVGAITGAIGLGVGFLWRALTQAAAGGRMSGVAEAQLAALALRVAALEADHRLTATREDIAELKQQARDNANQTAEEIRALRVLIFESRGRSESRQV